MVNEERTPITRSHFDQWSRSFLPAFTFAACVHFPRLLLDCARATIGLTFLPRAINYTGHGVSSARFCGAYTCRKPSSDAPGGIGARFTIAVSHVGKIGRHVFRAEIDVNYKPHKRTISDT